MKGIESKTSLAFLLLLVLSLVAPSPAVSQQASAAATARKDRSSRPITIKADELKADNKGKMAVFTGKVVARQEDVTIYADKLIIYYGEQQEEVDKIEAIGSVRILQTNRIGTGGHALYENRVGKITLSVNPKVTQDKDSVVGKVIIYYLDDERSEVIGGENSRVEAVIHPRPAAGARKNDGRQQR